MVMSVCDTTFVKGSCNGIHLGKYSSCLDEALDDLSLQEGDGVGDPDYGYAAPVRIEVAETVTLQAGTEHEIQVVVPPGNYIVWTSTAGAVTVPQYDTVDEADAAWDQWELAYEAWCAARSV
jgi:hypothetical protein